MVYSSEGSIPGAVQWKEEIKVPLIEFLLQLVLDTDSQGRRGAFSLC